MIEYFTNLFMALAYPAFALSAVLLSARWKDERFKYRPLLFLILIVTSVVLLHHLIYSPSYYSED